MEVRLAELGTQAAEESVKKTAGTAKDAAKSKAEASGGTDAEIKRKRQEADPNFKPDDGTRPRNDGYLFNTLNSRVAPASEGMPWMTGLAGVSNTPSRLPRRWGATSFRETAPLAYLPCTPRPHVA